MEEEEEEEEDSLRSDMRMSCSIVASLDLFLIFSSFRSSCSPIRLQDPHLQLFPLLFFFGFREGSPSLFLSSRILS